MTLIGIVDLGDRVIRVDSVWGEFTAKPSDDSPAARDIAAFCAWMMNGGKPAWERRIEIARDEAEHMARWCAAWRACGEDEWMLPPECRDEMFLWQEVGMPARRRLITQWRVF